MAVKCTAKVIIDWTPGGGYRTESCWFGQWLVQVDECRDGCCTEFQCPDCGERFWMEWPD
jgi:hypothetical protein